MSMKKFTLEGENDDYPYKEQAVYQTPDLSVLYEEIREDEMQNKDILLEFREDYPDVLNGDNLADILKAAKAKKEKNNN